MRQRDKTRHLAMPLIALALACACMAAPTAFAVQGGQTQGDSGLAATSSIATQADPQDISSATVAVADQTYTGSALQPAVTVTLDGKTLVAGTDYETLDASCYTGNVNVGTATVTVTAKDGSDYTGTAKGTFAVKPAAASSFAVTSLPSKGYTGSAFTPSPTVKFNGKTLAKDTDYTLSYSNNVNVGTANVNITGTGNFTGTKTVKFKITKASIVGAKIAKVAAQTYTGKYLTPKPTITYKGTTLKNNKDYTLKYKKNLNAGKAQIVVKGKGNFSGKKTATFKIKKARISTAKISIRKSYTYTGYSIEPTPTVKFRGKTVSKSNYSVSYSHNYNAGTARAIVKGKGNFTGKKAVKFKIKKASIADAYVARIVDQAYITGPLTPNPPVTYNGKTLKSGKDFKYIYSNNVNRGTAYLRVEGRGNFTGSQSTSFKIVNCAMYKCTVNAIPDQWYTGDYIYPDVTVRVAGNTLARGRDYQVTYENNLNRGTARVNIQGLGGFEGTVSRTFRIL